MKTTTAIPRTVLAISLFGLIFFIQPGPVHSGWDRLQITSSSEQPPAGISDQQIAEQSAAVQFVMYDIIRSAFIYQGIRGRWPESIDQLYNEGFADVGSRFWVFALTGERSKIVAISTPEMPGGAGHWVEYDSTTNTWHGYGIDSTDTPPQC